MISVVIPTFNRVSFWKQFPLLASLCEQSNKEFELLICDDGSTDETVDYLKANLPHCPFPARLFRTVASARDEAPGDSTIPDQVLFKEASGDMILHLDDDGYVLPRLVEMVSKIAVASPGICGWGEVRCMDDKGTVICPDNRILTMGPNKPNADLTMYQFDRNMTADNFNVNGSLWFAPTRIIRSMGGHDMKHLGFRGCDSRLGWRLLKLAPCLFVASDYTAFYHYGFSVHKVARHKGDHKTLGLSRTPTGNNMEPLLPVENGGDAFWSKFPISYQRIL